LATLLISCDHDRVVMISASSDDDRFDYRRLFGLGQQLAQIPFDRRDDPRST
jgi:hypothetical protein